MLELIRIRKTHGLSNFLLSFYGVDKKVKSAKETSNTVEESKTLFLLSFFDSITKGQLSILFFVC